MATFVTRKTRAHFIGSAIALLLLAPSATSSGQTGIAAGVKLYEAKRFEEAEKTFEAVGEESRDYASAQYYLGEIYFQKKDYEEAAEYFEEATEADPRNVDYLVRLGDAYALDAQNSNAISQGILAVKVKNAWEKVIGLDPSNVEARVSLIGFYSMAPGVMGGSMTRAKELATEVTKLDPAEGHWQMGSLLAKEQNTAGAEKELALMVKANPDYRRNLAGYYADQKQYDKAFELFEETLKKNPDDYLTLYRYGKSAALSGQMLDKGEECLKKYFTHTPAQGEPSRAGAYMRYAQIREKKGSKLDAKKYFEMALKEDGKLKEAKEGLERTSK